MLKPKTKMLWHRLFQIQILAYLKGTKFQRQCSNDKQNKKCKLIRQLYAFRKSLKIIAIKIKTKEKFN